MLMLCIRVLVWHCNILGSSPSSGVYGGRAPHFDIDTIGDASENNKTLHALIYS